MTRETTLGKHYKMDDEDLRWVYAYSEDSGGIFGLEMSSHPFMSPRDFLIVRTAGKMRFDRIMPRPGVKKGPLAVEYVDAMGDCSTHGATWDHFVQLVEPVVDDFRRLDDNSLELHLDGMQNMSLEGARRDGGGWAVIHEGLVDARNDVLMGNRFRQESLYQGLGHLARNFAEREEAAMLLATA